jgi:hypothetical protein
MQQGDRKTRSPATHHPAIAFRFPAHPTMRRRITVTIMLVAMQLTGCVSSSRIMDLAARQSSTCEVHQVVMAPKRVRMTYGMKRGEWFLSLWDARSRLFPHADEIYDTHACCGSYQKYARIYVCTACTEARTNWLETHPPRL